jgi:hypothetical protein
MAHVERLPFGHVILDEQPWHGTGAGAADADLRVRVPAELKHEIESAAARDGLPADLWLVEALGRSVGSARA